MNYKWLLIVGALVLLCVLFLINDNSYADYDEENSAFYKGEDVTFIEEETVNESKEDTDKSEVASIERVEDSLPPAEIPHGMEIPIKGPCHNIFVSHEGYSLSYDTIRHCPFWVAWELTSIEAQGNYGRSNDYRPDPQLPYNHQVSETTFGGSGYDKGHMCPAGDQKWSEQAMSESFYMSNMCPQDPTLNQVWWEHLETAERRWAQQEGSVYLVCGPIFDNNKKTKWIEGYNVNVGIPDRFFKVVLSLKRGNEKAIGFIFKNDGSRQPVGKASCSVNDVEKVTGYNFFYTLDDELEERLESNYNIGKWN